MPVVFEFAFADFKLSSQQFFRMFGIVDEDVLHAEELRLVILYDTGIWSDCSLTIRERVECVDGLVRRNVVRKMDDEVCSRRGHILYLLDLYLALVFSLQDGIHESMSRLSIRYLLDGESVLVDFLYLGPDFHRTATLPFHVFRAVCETSGREVRQQLERLTLEISYRSVYQFVEVMRENLGSHTDRNSLSSLCKKQREPYRKLSRLLISTVIGCHPVGDLRVENHFLREFA